MPDRPRPTPQVERSDCPACGTWHCSNCEGRRAGVGPNDVVTCDWCGSTEGVFRPARHRNPEVARAHAQAASAGKGTADWARPTMVMFDMENLSGVTLRAACAALGLPVSGPKVRLAGRLVDQGLTAAEVNDRYGWRARSQAMPGSTPGATHSIGRDLPDGSTVHVDR